MKLSPIVLVSFLPLLALGNPIAEAEPGTLEPRADKWCTLNPGEPHRPSTNNVKCRPGPNRNDDSVRIIHAGERFGVRCKDPRGEFIFGNPVWDYIPGWNCWVSAFYTNIGCETDVRNCP